MDKLIRFNLKGNMRLNIYLSELEATDPDILYHEALKRFKSIGLSEDLIVSWQYEIY